MQTILVMLMVAASAAILYTLARVLPRRVLGCLTVAAIAAAFMQGFRAGAQTGTDAMAIITTVTNDLPTLFGACISIGAFFIIYRLVRKVR
jgi:hypothetical protein